MKHIYPKNCRFHSRLAHSRLVPSMKAYLACLLVQIFLHLSAPSSDLNKTPHKNLESARLLAFCTACKNQCMNKASWPSCQGRRLFSGEKRLSNIQTHNHIIEIVILDCEKHHNFHKGLQVSGVSSLNLIWMIFMSSYQAAKLYQKQERD